MDHTNCLTGSILSEKNKLAELICEGTLVNVYLTTGIKLQGYILAVDTHTILLQSNPRNTNPNSLIYKHAISTIIPNKISL